MLLYGRMKRNCFKPGWAWGKSCSASALSWSCSGLYIRNNTSWDYSSKTVFELPNKLATSSASTPNFEELECKLFTDLEMVGADWDLLAQRSGITFLQRPYLKVLSSAPPAGMRFGYLLVYSAGLPSALAVCQIKHFSAGESIQVEESTSTEPCFFDGLTKWFKKRVAGWVDADILVIGNLLVSGQYGYWIDESRLGVRQFAEGIVSKLPEIVDFFQRNHSKIDLILFKDVAKEHQPVFNQVFSDDQFVAFEIQPSMELDLPSPDFQGYLDAMSTKYRTRAKRAFKKAEKLERRVMSKEELAMYEGTLYGLYRQVANNAGFNVVDLHPSYNLRLATGIEASVRVVGYFEGQQLLAFYSTIQNGSTLEAHFVGYDKSRNHALQLYLNLLYDMIREAYEQGCKRISFARTALEIKSSVGAIPHDYTCYLRHQNPYVNKLTGSILDYLKPVEEWVQRHPFKQTDSSEES